MKSLLIFAWPTRALLLAGLCVFSSSAIAVEATPSLSPTAKVTETVVIPKASPEARRILPSFDADAFKRQLKGDLESVLRDEIGRQLKKDLEIKVDEDLKREAARISAKVGEDMVDLKIRVDGLRVRLEQNEKDLADAQRQRAGLEAQLKEALDAQGRQADQIKNLNDKAGKAEKDLALGLKRVEDLAESLELKGEKMTGLLDVVGTLKRDLRDLNADLVELKGDLKAMQNKGADDGELGWWSKASRWPYLPAVAAGLSAIALGIAVTR